MALEFQPSTATIPPTTPIAAPVTVAITMPARVVRQIDWRVPAGPMGVLGWQVAMGGVKVFPTSGDTWVLAHDEHGTWQVNDAPDSGSWQVIGHNTGTHAHSLYLAFHCDLPARPLVISAPISATDPMQPPD